jgi:hypothetical protein
VWSNRFGESVCLTCAQVFLETFQIHACRSLSSVWLHSFAFRCLQVLFTFTCPANSLFRTREAVSKPEAPFLLHLHLSTVQTAVFVSMGFSYTFPRSPLACLARDLFHRSLPREQCSDVPSDFLPDGYVNLCFQGEVILLMHTHQLVCRWLT